MDYYSTPHTPADLDALIAAGTDPTTSQPRERLVPCATCGAATRNLMAACDLHYTAPPPRIRT